MKIACTADWHIHQFKEFAKPLQVYWSHSTQRFVPYKDGKEMNSRLFNILDGLCDIRDYCVHNNIKIVLNAGDTFHKRGTINVETFNAAYAVIESFQKSGISLYSLAGNHDQVDSSDIPETSIHTLRLIQHVIEQPTKIAYENFPMVAIPYSANKDFVLHTLNEYLQRVDSHNAILMMHCGVSGAVVGSGMYSMTDEYTLEDLHYDEWKYVVLGHYHRPQLLADNTFYCGTPVQESFNDEIIGEDGYNGFYVIDTDDTNVQFVPIHKPRFITVTDVNDMVEGNYYRFQVGMSDWENLEESTKEIVQKSAKVEITKDYSTESRSSVGIADDLVTAVQKYSKEQHLDTDTALLGLQILSEAAEVS